MGDEIETRWRRDGDEMETRWRRMETYGDVWNLLSKTPSGELSQTPFFRNLGPPPYRMAHFAHVTSFRPLAGGLCDADHGMLCCSG
jgi:hypothetical protein